MTVPRDVMEGIMTVKDLIEDLSERDPTAPVMIAVVKYPGEFRIKFTDDGPRWTDHDDVEVIPLTFDDVINIDGIIHLAAELEEFNAERWMLDGNRAD